MYVLATDSPSTRRYIVWGACQATNQRPAVIAGYFRSIAILVDVTVSVTVVTCKHVLLVYEYS